MAQLKLHFSQRKNILVNYLDKSIKYEFGSTHADYEFTNGVIIIYIQLRYLLTASDYLDTRLSYFRERSKDQTRICLCYHDINDVSEGLLLKVNRLCLLYDFTLLCAYSIQDAARYVSYLGQDEPSDLNRLLRSAEKENLPLPKIKGVLSENEIRKLITAKGSLAELFTSSSHDLALVPGFKPSKCSFLWKIFNSPLNSGVSVPFVKDTSENDISSKGENFLNSFATQTTLNES